MRAPIEGRAKSRAVDSPVISIVAPAYNEAKNLLAFIEAMTPVLDSLGDPWEIVFVDDGSRDDTLGMLLAARSNDSRIKVVSLVGRFLEHSRIYYFANNGDEELYFGSADWMPRNFDRRVEVITPIEDRSLHSRVFALLETCLVDNRLAWDLHPDGTYVQRKPGTRPVVSAHERYLANSWGLQALPPARENGAEGPRAEYPASRQSAAPTSSS